MTCSSRAHPGTQSQTRYKLLVQIHNYWWSRTTSCATSTDRKSRVYPSVFSHSHINQRTHGTRIRPFFAIHRGWRIHGTSTWTKQFVCNTTHALTGCSLVGRGRRFSLLRVNYVLTPIKFRCRLWCRQKKPTSLFLPRRFCFQTHLHFL